MATLPLSDALLQQAVDARAVHSTDTAAAQAVGISRGAFYNRVLRAAERGLMGTAPVLPGFAIKKTSTQTGPDGELQREWVQQAKAPGEAFTIPDGHVIKGVSALTDPSGRVMQQWVKTREGQDPLSVIEAIKTAFIGYAGPGRPAAVPSPVDADVITLVPLADWHIGLYAWKAETNSNWDLRIAEETIGAAIDDLIMRSPPSGRAVVLGGGDLLHSDNSENKTAKSGNALDVDGRYQKVLMTACRLVVRAIDTCLTRHQQVTVRILPGNHDEHSAVAVAYFLAAWFRAEPRVTVDLDPSLFFWLRFGRVLLGATHGHLVKVKDMASIMAHRRAPDWGETRFRYVHGFHLHHSAKTVTEGEGVISEIHQTPTPQDAWHFGSGFLSGRSVQAITYHREFGEVSRSRVAILD